MSAPVFLKSGASMLIRPNGYHRTLNRFNVLKAFVNFFFLSVLFSCSLSVLSFISFIFFFQNIFILYISLFLISFFSGLFHIPFFLPFLSFPFLSSFSFSFSFPSFLSPFFTFTVPFLSFCVVLLYCVSFKNAFIHLQ